MNRHQGTQCRNSRRRFPGKPSRGKNVATNRAAQDQARAKTTKLHNSQHQEIRASHSMQAHPLRKDGLHIKPVASHSFVEIRIRVPKTSVYQEDAISAGDSSFCFSQIVPKRRCVRAGHVCGVETHCGIPTRRTKSWKRGSECKLSHTECVLAQFPGIVGQDQIGRKQLGRSRQQTLALTCGPKWAFGCSRINRKRLRDANRGRKLQSILSPSRFLLISHCITTC